ncbi:MAG: hypothetical protein JO309_11010 [Pseudonocardiales bacterium]|nr:hypothetical protein [Pseudonocardiales bacterium]
MVRRPRSRASPCFAPACLPTHSTRPPPSRPTNRAHPERDFHSIKTDDLDLHPTHHYLSDRVRAHVLICMLASYLTWHLRAALAELTYPDKHPPTRDNPPQPDHLRQDDVWVIERTGHQCLALEAALELRVCGQLRSQQFQRDGSAKTPVRCPVYDASATTTDQRVDAIARDLGTDDWNHPLATLHQRSARSYRHQYAWIIMPGSLMITDRLVWVAHRDDR